MSSAVATPRSSMRIASRPSATPRRLEAKPGESLTRIGSLPSWRANATARSMTPGSERSCVTTSTSLMACTGLKKCSPTTRPGSRTACAIAAIESEDVFVASSASWGAASCRSANRRRFRARSSATASITISVPATAAPSWASARRRCATAAPSASLSLPRFTAPATSSPIRSMARASASARLSVSATLQPPSAAAQAMPWPIVPAPMTATRPTLMRPPRSRGGPRRGSWCRSRPRRAR